MRYNTTIQDIALAGLFLSLAMVASLISVYVIPTIPFIGNKITLWSAFAISGLFFQKNIYISFTYIIALVFGLMIIELPMFMGIADYMLEDGAAIIFLSCFLFLKLIKNKILFLMSLISLILLWSLLRWILFSLAGSIFWNIPFVPSMIFNGPVVLADLFIMVPIIFSVCIKLYLNKKSYN